MKATLLRDGVSCLQRDQSYVVGGVYIRGSMELRASPPLRHPPFRPPSSVPFLLSFSRLSATQTNTHAIFGPELLSRTLRRAELFPQRHISLTHTHALATRC